MPSNPGDTTNYPGWVEVTEFWLVTTPGLGVGQGKLCSMPGGKHFDYSVESAIIMGTNQKPKDIVVVIRGNKQGDIYRDVREFVLEVPGDDRTGDPDDDHPFEERFDIEDRNITVNSWADETGEDEEEDLSRVDVFDYGRIYEYNGDAGEEGDPQDDEERRLELDKWHWRWWAYNIAITDDYPTQYVIREGEDPTPPDPEQTEEEDEEEEDKDALEVRIDRRTTIDGITYFAAGYHVHLGVGSINPGDEDDERRVTLFDPYTVFRFRADDLAYNWESFYEGQVADGNPLGFGWEEDGSEEDSEEDGSEEDPEEEMSYLTGGLMELSWVLATWIERNNRFEPVHRSSEIPDYLEGDILNSTKFSGRLSESFELIPIKLPVVKLEYGQDDIDPDTPEPPNIYNVPSAVAVVMRRNPPTPPED